MPNPFDPSPVEWVDYEDDTFRMRVPSYLKKHKRHDGFLIAGRKNKLILHMLVQIVDESREMWRGVMMQARDSDWMGSTNTVLRRGPVPGDPDAFEYLLSATTPIHDKGLFSYSIVFRRVDRWMKVDVLGQRDLEAFETCCAEIVASVHLRPPGKVGRPAKATTTIQDVVFGSLSDGPPWTATIRLGALDNVQLVVTADDEQPLPSDGQRDAYRHFLKNKERIETDLAAAISKHIRLFRRTMQESGFPDSIRELIPNTGIPDNALDVMAPEPAQAADVWALLRDVDLIVPPQRTGQQRLRLGCGCTWDEEHGVGIEIRKGKAGRVTDRRD